LTSEEIALRRNSIEMQNKIEILPLWEIAYQLSIHNERNDKLVQRSEDAPGIRERGGDVRAEFDCPIATGYRCYSCKYERTFADLKPEGQHQLEAGLCPACDSSEIGIVFDGPAWSIVDPELGSHSTPVVPATEESIQTKEEYLAPSILYATPLRATGKHVFVEVSGNHYCGRCAGGKRHPIHTLGNAV
jgi:hypothetical protein